MKFNFFYIENLNSSKRIGFLFEIAFSKENLYAAFLDARKGKRKKKKVFEFEKHLSTNIDTLHNELHLGNYKISKYEKFTIFEKKERVIYAPQFRDLVVQHAIYRVIYDIFNQSFIDTSFGCRKFGGTHAASKYTQNEMKKYSDDHYYAKLDIKGFFYNIDREILAELFKKKIKDKRFLKIMCDFMYIDDKKTGLPIGNLLSQLYALIVLNELDHFAKRELKTKSYVRYVDDFVGIGLSLEEAKNFKDRCEKFVQNNLNLELSHWTIKKHKLGINFVGYRTWSHKKLVRKHSVYTFKKAILRRDMSSAMSCIGHVRGTESVPYYSKLINKIKQEKQNV